MMLDTEENVDQLEISLLLDAIQKRYGWDFTHYKRASIHRSLKRLCSKQNVGHIAELIPKIMVDQDFFEEFIYQISIPVSEMFRDPYVFLAIREKLVPILKTYPFIKIWHAGCASGEEVFSLAILLQEEGLYERARIYGTDINSRVIERAREGIFLENKLGEYNENYKRAGGKHSLKDYFHTRYDSMIIDSSLKKNISFFNHNLATDESFGEMHLILCRNVLIYFDKNLQARSVKLFDDSLVYGGFLCLGTKESLDFIDVPPHLALWLKKEKIYRKHIGEKREPHR